MKHDRHTYRGKALSDQHVKIGEWVYGGLFKTEDGCWIVRLAPGEFEAGIIQHIRVDPDTVGQCSGLESVNSTELFEGDIIKRQAPHFNTPYVIEFGWYDGEYEDSRDCYGFYINEIATGCKCNPNDIDKYLEIGNCWDNPELLEVGP